MMSLERTFDFVSLQQTLRNWPTVTLPDEGCKTDDPIMGRILQILRVALSVGVIESAPDFITLIRQLLTVRINKGRSASLRIPAYSGWPNATIWNKYCLNVTKIEDHLIIEPKPWMPKWLGSNTESDHDIFEPEFSDLMVRQSAHVPMDPFLTKACGYNTYICPGQREAVRSLLFMPSGSTLIVNLPTGSGKSLVGETPTLLNGIHNGLTLFIVPTIALAIDLSRRMKELLLLRYSNNEIPEMTWHSGCADEVKSGIKQRIRNGSQGILFASPESMVGALLPSLNDAAKAGLLKYLVIDEAHLVAQWGDGFRPAFQALSGIRRGLLRRCEGEQFRTILMSATFSKQTVTTLDVLFGPKEKIQMVSAIHLRPEPRYFSYKVCDWNEKQEKLLELLRHVPRPFILYVTERKHADDWLRILRQEGYIRLTSFHGNTLNSRREEIIDQWVQDKLDGIVATSAFGVGMDKGNVRTVIHAAVPETLDRYYQEVGRGGRDGYASLSIVLYSERDEGIARGMSKQSVIGDDKAYSRWKTMFTDPLKSKVGEDLHLIDLNAVPHNLKQQTDYNAAWNMRILISMARAGLIELESISPDLPERHPDDSDDDYDLKIDEHWKDFYMTMPVRTLDPHHLNQEHFEKIFGEERIRGIQAAEHSFNYLISALNNERKISDVLSELFSSHEPDRIVMVSTACRNFISSSNVTQVNEVNYQIPIGIGIEKIVPPRIELWKQRFPWLHGTPVVILCPDSEPGLSDKVILALKVLVSMFGIKEVCANREYWNNNENLRQLDVDVPDRVLIARILEEDRNLPESALPIPRATLLLPWQKKTIPDHILLLNRPLHIIFAPENIPSSHPLRLYQDDSTNHIHLNEFLRITTQ